MASNIDEFVGKVKSPGFSIQSQFEFTLALPAELQGIVDQNKLKLQCYQANTPGYNFETESEFVDGNERRKFVYDYSKSDLTLGFYVDSNLDVVALFDAWKKLIFPSGRMISLYEKYTTTGVLEILAKEPQSAKIVYTYKFVELFPSSFQQLNYDWNNNTIQLYQAVFHYRTVETESASGKSSSSSKIKDAENNKGGFFGGIGGSLQGKSFTDGILGDSVAKNLLDRSKTIADSVAGDVSKAMESASKTLNGQTIGDLKDTANSLKEGVAKTKGLVASTIETVNETVKTVVDAYDAVVDEAVAAYNNVAEQLDLTNIGAELGKTAEILGEGTQRLEDLTTFFPNSSKLQKLSQGMRGITDATAGAGEASTQAGNTQPQDAANTTINKTIPSLKGAIKAFKKF